MNNTLVPLDINLLKSACLGHVIGRKICAFEKVSSTNDVALEWGEHGEPEGCVAIAEYQNAGRGQFGRGWHSAPRRGIWCSLLLRPSFSPSYVACLTPFAVVATVFSIRRFLGLEVAIKWPNDLYLSRGKAGGILIEARTGGNFFAVVGLGINVNQNRNDFPAALQGIATSLREETGFFYDRTQIMLAILTELDHLYPHLVSHFSVIHAFYKSWLRWDGSLTWKGICT